MTAKNVSLLKADASMQLEIANLKSKFEKQVKDGAEASKKVKVLTEKVASLTAQNEYSKKALGERQKSIEEQKSLLAKLGDELALAGRTKQTAERRVDNLEKDVSKCRAELKAATKSHRENLQRERERL